MKQAALRPLAESDLIERTHHHRKAGGKELGERLFEAALAALHAVEDRPGLGSPDVGELVGLPGLRRIGVAGFPCGWLHLERADVIDVVRLLADRQDLGALLDDPGSEPRPR